MAKKKSDAKTPEPKIPMTAVNFRCPVVMKRNLEILACARQETTTDLLQWLCTKYFENKTKEIKAAEKVLSKLADKASEVPTFEDDKPESISKNKKVPTAQVTEEKAGDDNG